jgi:nucleotide-binding universal stress UspA family protein
MIKRILIPTDFSESSQAAIRSGLDLADTVGGEIILLHVIEEEPDCLYVVGGRPVFLRDEFASDIDLSRYPLPQRIIRRDLCEEAYWKLAAMFPPAFQTRVRTVVTVGKPANEIVRVAREQGADLIMLGSRGRRGLRRLLRRTVADKVRRKAPIPVIAVDAQHRGTGEAPGRSGTSSQRAAGDHVDFQRDERVHIAKPMARSCCRADASTTPVGIEKITIDA